MKKYLLLFGLMIFGSSCFATEGSIKISIDKSVKGNFIIFRNSTPLEERLSPFTLNAKYIRSLNIPYPLIFYKADDTCIPIFLQPGEEVSISKRNGSYSFEIKSNELRTREQHLLMIFVNKFGAIYGPMNKLNVSVNLDKSSKQSLDNEFDRLIAEYKMRETFLDSLYTLRKISRQFNFYIKNHIYYSYLNSLLELKVVGYNSFKFERIWSENFKNLQISFCIKEMMFIDTYRHFLSKCEQNDIFSGLAVNDITSKPVLKCFAKDFILYQRVQILLNEYSVSKDSVIANSIMQISDISYRDRLKSLWNTQNNISNISNSTSLMDLKNRAQVLSLQLSKYSKKTVVLDFWATWCIPCVNEFRKHQKFLSSINKDSNIIVVYISMDTDIKSWKDAINNFPFMNTNNSFLMIGNFKSKLAKSFEINSIPREIVLKDAIVTRMNLENFESIYSSLNIDKQNVIQPD